MGRERFQIFLRSPQRGLHLHTIYTVNENFCVAEVWFRDALCKPHLTIHGLR
jgi:hypothetical protein